MNFMSMLVPKNKNGFGFLVTTYKSDSLVLKFNQPLFYDSPRFSDQSSCTNKQ